MPRFPELPEDHYASIYLEDTDRPLPEKINQNTRYAYYKTIAQGGKAVIRSCKDMHLSRVVCEKKLRPEFADDPAEQQRLLREARVTASLQHPNVVPTYEIGRDSKGHYFFTMKLVHGLTMRELLHKDYRDRYDLNQLVDVLAHVTNAVRYAHSHRVIHRDIKPDNILIGPYAEVLLMDWGLAKVWNKDGESDEPTAEREVVSEEPVSTLTGVGKLEGTIAYMSPEQLRKDPEIDFRTDIYSLGVVLYEVLAQRTPFAGETISQMKEEIFHKIPRPPSKLTSAFVPQHLDDLAMKCIQKAPGDRASDCGELVRGLQQEWRR